MHTSGAFHAPFRLAYHVKWESFGELGAFLEAWCGEDRCEDKWGIVMVGILWAVEPRLPSTRDPSDVCDLHCI